MHQRLLLGGGHLFPFINPRGCTPNPVLANPMHPDQRTSCRRIGGLVVVLLCTSLVATYVGTYFALATKVVWPDGTETRHYSRRWQAAIFKPAMVIESIVRGKQIDAGWPTVE